MWQMVHFYCIFLSLPEAMFIGFKEGEMEK